jgi:hypothetical protein
VGQVPELSPLQVKGPGSPRLPPEAGERIAMDEHADPLTSTVWRTFMKLCRELGDLPVIEVARQRARRHDRCSDGQHATPGRKNRLSREGVAWSSPK